MNKIKLLFLAHLGFLFLGMPISACCQAGIPDTALAKSLRIDAKKLARIGKTDSAFSMMEKAYRIYQNAGDVEGEITCEILKGYILLKSRKVKEGYLEMEKTLAKSVKVLSSPHKLIADCYSQTAIFAIYSGEKAQCKAYFIKALEIREALPGKKTTGLAGEYVNLSIFLKREGRHREAMKYLDRALEILDEIGESAYTSTTMVSAYMATANNYVELGDYETAFDYFEKALHFQKTYSPDPDILAKLYSNMGIAYYNAEDFDNAVHYFEESYRLFKASPTLLPADGFIPLTNLGNAYFNLQQYDKALDYSSLSIQLIEKTKGPDDAKLIHPLVNSADALRMQKKYALANAKLNRAEKVSNLHNGLNLNLIYNTYSKIYKDQNIKQKAIDYALKSTAFSNGLSDSPNTFYAEDLKNQGETYFHFGETLLAVQSIQKAISIYKSEVDSKDYTQNPRPFQGIWDQDIISLLYLKATYCRSFYQKNSHSSAQLELAFKTIQTGIAMLDSVRLGFNSLESRKKFQQESMRILEEGMLIAHLKYKATQDLAWLDTAFQFSDKGKYLTLATSLQAKKAIAFSPIPKDLLEQEKTLHRDIAYFQKKIFAEKLKPTDSTLLSEWQSHLFETKEQLQKWEKNVKQNYPGFYQMKYLAHIPSAAEVQEELQNSNTQFISYFEGQDSLYVFSITSDHISLHTLATDSNYQQIILNWTSNISDRNLAESRANTSEVFQSFTQNAYEIYRGILAPVIDSKSKKIIISPDGVLGFVPFDLLLTSDKSNVLTGEYHALPYLIRDVVIAYAFSAQIMIENPIASGKANRNYLGMAPEYSSQSFLTGEGKLENLYAESRSGFNRLRFNQQEVTNIFDLLGGKKLLGANASKSEFMQHAGNCQVLHLAMHAYTHHEDPLYSGFVFENEQNGNPDMLHAYEIYQIPLQADLAVLSACNTGVGKLQRGEGIMSLARAFRYAGCPSTLMSLWQADDEVTASLVEEFFVHLKAGLSKDEALRKAKISYLDSGKKLHPHYWGAFVLMGDAEPISFGMGWNWGWWVLGIGVGIALLFIFFQFRKRLSFR